MQDIDDQVVGFKPLALKYKICIMCRVSDYRVYMYIDFVSLAKVLYTHHFRMNVTSIAQRTSERGL